MNCERLVAIAVGLIIGHLLARYVLIPPLERWLERREHRRSRHESDEEAGA